MSIRENQDLLFAVHRVALIGTNDLFHVSEILNGNTISSSGKSIREYYSY